VVNGRKKAQEDHGAQVGKSPRGHRTRPRELGSTQKGERNEENLRVAARGKRDKRGAKIGFRKKSRSHSQKKKKEGI